MNIDNLSNYVGMLTELECPECKSLIIQDMYGTQWCSGNKCTWSNNEELQELIEIMKHEDNRQIFDGEETDQ
jgi:hypothetical protein